MIKYLDEDDYNKLRILNYLENNPLSTILLGELMEELSLNNYYVKKLLLEIQDDIETWGHSDSYKFDISTKKGYVRYERKSQSNITVLLSKYTQKSKNYALIKTVLTEEVERVTDLEKKVFLSRSATYKLLKDFSELSRDYGITIEKNLKFTGSEWMIREFLYNYYDTLYLDFHRTFSDEITEILGEVLEKLEKIEGLFHQKLSLRDKIKVKLRLFIIYIRNYFGHAVEIKDFIRKPHPLVQPIQQVLEELLDTDSEAVETESYAFLYFLFVENIITEEHNYDLPEPVRRLTAHFNREFCEAFPDYQEEIKSRKTQQEINNIHLQLYMSLKTNFELLETSKIAFVQENYQKIENFCYQVIDKKIMVSDLSLLIQENYEELAKEYLFLLLSSTSIYKTSPPIKVYVDFSYGKAYNHFILETVKILKFMNLQVFTDSWEEDIDIYLSNTPVSDTEFKARQIIWAVPPSSYDWEYFGNVVIDVKNEKNQACY